MNQKTPVFSHLLALSMIFGFYLVIYTLLPGNRLMIIIICITALLMLLSSSMVNLMKRMKISREPVATAFTFESLNESLEQQSGNAEPKDNDGVLEGLLDSMLEEPPLQDIYRMDVIDSTKWLPASGSDTQIGPGAYEGKFDHCKVFSAQNDKTNELFIPTVIENLTTIKDKEILHESGSKGTDIDQPSNNWIYKLKIQVITRLLKFCSQLYLRMMQQGDQREERLFKVIDSRLENIKGSFCSITDYIEFIAARDIVNQFIIFLQDWIEEYDELVNQNRDLEFSEIKDQQLHVQSTSELQFKDLEHYLVQMARIIHDLGNSKIAKHLMEYQQFMAKIMHIHINISSIALQDIKIEIACLLGDLIESLPIENPVAVLKI
ncbi:MAG: hypothetical protein ACFFD4_37960 [Candidatus Odinarchaeota archaeon]